MTAQIKELRQLYLDNFNFDCYLPDAVVQAIIDNVGPLATEVDTNIEVLKRMVYKDLQEQTGARPTNGLKH